MPPARTRRQEPASCEQCRKKKLKCDRLPLCGNCRVRSLQCTYAAQQTSQLDAPASVQVQGLGELRVENAAIRSRLDRLEAFILQHKGSEALSSHGVVDLDSDTKSSLPSVLPATRDQIPKGTDIFFDESGRPGTVNLGQCKGVPTTSDPLTIDVRPLRQLVSYISSSSTNSRLSIALPTREETEWLIDSGLARLDLVQHVIYRPSMRAILEQVYEQITTSQPQRFSHVVLILALIASVAHSWGCEDQEESVFDTASDAARISGYWWRSGLNVLEQAWRFEPLDLTTVQATIILVFLTFHFEALSPRVRFLHSTAIAFAKDIGIHTTDSHLVRLQTLSQEQIIDREMRRRVWWHLAATDWSLALCGGQQDGTYTIHPRHMRVLKPRNISDDELRTMPADFSHDQRKPTMMAWFLHRLRVGELCREVADLTWDVAGSDVDEIPYTDVIPPLDRKFEHLLDDIPAQLSEEDVKQSPAWFSRSLAVQRCITTFTVQARRCKLHLPFLLRAARNERYAFSRETCLRAARNMLDYRKYIHSSDTHSPLVDIRVRVMVLHHFFCATVVLVMDLCTNRAVGSEEERKAEIQAACSFLEDARQYSGSADVLLEALMDIMHRHKVRLQSLDQDLHVVDGKSKFSSEPQVMINDKIPVMGDINHAPAAENLDFGDLWQSYLDMGPDISPREWDALFADLDCGVS